MRICHVTPHLPPDQAANALLPFHLGSWAADTGDDVTYVSYRPRALGTAGLPGPVVWVSSPRELPAPLQTARLAGPLAAVDIVRRASPSIESADIVHVHSNGLLAEVGALLARRKQKPVVLTLYGTEIWHYEPRRRRPDLFTRAYRQATVVTFYSQGLATRAQEVGLARHNTAVIYPPVAAAFEWRDADGHRVARYQSEFRNRHLLVNVKRLHPLGGQRYLIEAMNEVIRTHPDTRLVICGTGPLESELKALAVANGVAGHVTFTGLVDNRSVARYCMAADAFVLPSLLEACPTVALEALACGTPVIAADSPGGVELNELFGVDVLRVPKGDATALARAIVELLESKRRARDSTRALIERDFRPPAVARQFRDVYEKALDLSRRA